MALVNALDRWHRVDTTAKGRPPMAFTPLQMTGVSAARRPPQPLVATALVVISLIVGCSTGGPSPPPPAPARSSPSPSLAILTAGPASPSPSPVAQPSPSPARDGNVIGVAMEDAIAALMSAIGNPDTDTPSEAMLDFEAAMASGDATRIQAAADVILGYVTDGRERLASVDGPACGAFCVEWDELFAHVGEGVGLMRDGAIDHADARVADGRALIQEGLLDHFWQGIRGEDPEAFVVHLADGRIANASRARLSTPAGAAFDGDAESAWTSGDAPAPQWIALDLGAASDVRSVRLLTFQGVAGRTEYRVGGCGEDGIEVELARLAGDTTDRQWLETDQLAATGIRVLRVTTSVAPGSIGWREVEIDLADGTSPTPAGGSGSMGLCGLANLAVGATATGEPSTPGSEPGLAVDGDAGTSWDAGAGGRLRLTLAGSARLTEIRVLEGNGGPTSWSITGVRPGGSRMMIGELTDAADAGTWRSVSVDATEAYREIELVVRSPTSMSEVVEIEVIGAPIR